MRSALIAILTVVCLALIIGVFFGEVLDGGAYYPGDIARIYLPQRAELQQALRAGELPWWSTNLGAGYPLLAEGEVGALYPPNWPLYALLPVETALNVSIILHYLISGLGLYLLARGFALSLPASLFAALAWAFGGFGVAHLSHLSILSTIAWLPWMLYCTHRLLRCTHHRIWVVFALAVVVALQFLAGHPQMALLNLLAVAAFALALAWRLRSRTTGRAALLWIAALGLGTLLAAPQLLPAYQLGALSQRAGGLEGEFFTSYSFHPFLVSTFVSPFALGNPYPEGTVELMGYMGLLPLALSSVALWRSRRRAPWFFLALAALGLALAFGRWNPLYQYLQKVPVFNLFRVPARYLCWTSLALALLSAFGWDALTNAPPGNWGRPQSLWVVPVGLGLAAIVVFVLANGSATDDLVDAWRWLPAAFAGIAFVLLAAGGRSPRPVWAVAAIAALLVDLYAYGAVLDNTWNASLPLAEVQREPLSVAVLREDASLYRVYTKEEIVPALAPLRESLYPNIASRYGVASANLYIPLVPTNYGDYVADLDARRLNLLNAKYYLIPQLLPVDEASELYDVANPFADLPTGRWFAIPPSDLRSLSVESYLSHAADLPDGTLAATILLRTSDGRQIELPLRAGIESAEWAYERSDVLQVVAHSRAPLASTWPARSGYPPEDHTGHTYEAKWEFAPSVRVEALLIQPSLPEAYVRLVRVRLQESDGDEVLLAHLLGLGDHSIVYRSEDVLVYRNEDAFPRAFVLPSQLANRTDGGIRLVNPISAQEVQPAAIVSYKPMRVELRCNPEQESYLVLSDLNYPGWHVAVDGVAAPLLSAEGTFRAVLLGPGQHEVVFAFGPFSALWGAR